MSVAEASEAAAVGLVMGLRFIFPTAYPQGIVAPGNVNLLWLWCYRGRGSVRFAQAAVAQLHSSKELARKKKGGPARCRAALFSSREIG